MGITGLVRWTNAPTTGVDLIRQNLLLNHQGILRGRWQLNLGSYRSTLGNPSLPGFQVFERPMFTVTMNDNVFVVLEDPAAPTRADVSQQGLGHPSPPHWRNTLVTVSPPGALEQLLTQLRARWVSVRRGAPGPGQRDAGLGQQHLTVDGLIFTISNDWLIRFGHVILPGGAVKGMLIEVEYLPVPVLQTDAVDGSSALLQEMLMSVLPLISDFQYTAVNVSNDVWEEVLSGMDEEEDRGTEKKPERASTREEDLWVSPDEMSTATKKNDWTGVSRDRRSAYQIVGALRAEGLL